jgi:ADP-heptose:LPS heptosyltransferase
MNAKRVLRELESFWRHAIVYPLLRLVFRNDIINSKIDITSVRQILILRYDRIGDIIVTLPLVRLMKEKNPALTIGILASPLNAQIVQDEECIDDIHIMHKNWIALLKEILRARKKKYDVVLNLIFNRTTSGGIFANLVAPHGLKIGQGADKYSFYFNKLLRLNRGDKHMVEVIGEFVEQTFGIPVSSETLRLRLSVSRDSRESIDQYCEESFSERAAHRSRYIVFNISATDHVRRLSEHQSLTITRYLSHQKKKNTVVISASSDAQQRDRIVQETRSSQCLSFPRKGSAALPEIAALIERASFVVTPDTAIIHIASALGVPVIGYFTPLQVAAEWKPYGIRSEIVLADDGCTVSDIPIDSILKPITLFSEEFGSQRVEVD